MRMFLKAMHYNVTAITLLLSEGDRDSNEKFQECSDLLKKDDAVAI